MPPWLASRAPTTRPEPPASSVASLASCSSSPRLPLRRQRASTIDDWLASERLHADAEGASTTSDGEDSESESDSFNAGEVDATPGRRAARPPEDERVIACFCSASSSSYSVAAEAAAAAALEDALEIDEWYEEQRARDSEACSRWPSSYATPARLFASLCTTPPCPRARATMPARLTRDGCAARGRCAQCLWRLHARLRELLSDRFS